MKLFALIALCSAQWEDPVKEIPFMTPSEELKFFEHE